MLRVKQMGVEELLGQCERFLNGVAHFLYFKKINSSNACGNIKRGRERERSNSTSGGREGYLEVLAEPLVKGCEVSARI